MARESKLTIRVSSSRATSTVRYSTTGKYGRLLTNGLNGVMTELPLFTTASSADFWAAVIPLVQSSIEPEA